MEEVKKNSPPVSLSPQFATEVLRNLFPGDECSDGLPAPSEEETLEETTFPYVTEREVVSAARYLKSGKAPGLDGVPPIMIKAVANYKPNTVAALFNGILTRGQQGKDPATSSAYEPICVIGTLSKLFEYIARDRILSEIRAQPFEKNQYGLAKGKSAISAMEEIRKTAREATEQQRYAVCTLWSSLQATEKVMTNELVCPFPEEICEDIFYVEDLQNENWTKPRSLYIRAPVFCVLLVKQLTSDRKCHDDHACMSIS